MNEIAACLALRTVGSCSGEAAAALLGPTPFTWACKATEDVHKLTLLLCALNERQPTPLELPGCDHGTSTCLPFSAEGPVGGDVAAAGPGGMPARPFTYGFPPRPRCPAWPLMRERGPVGGVAPIREPAAGAPAEDEDDAAGEDAWMELRSARGARGGAFPDIDEHGAMEEGESEGGGGRSWQRWWSWVKRHRPLRLRALVRHLRRRPLRACLPLSRASQYANYSLKSSLVHGIRTATWTTFFLVRYLRSAHSHHPAHKFA